MPKEAPPRGWRSEVDPPYDAGVVNSLQDKVNELAAEFALGVIRALCRASVAEIADFSAALNGRPSTTTASRKIAVPEPVAGKSPPQTRARRSKGASESLHRAKRIVAVDASDAVSPEPQRAPSQRPGPRKTLPPPRIEDEPAVEPVVEKPPVISAPIRSPEPERPQSEPARPLPEAHLVAVLIEYVQAHPGASGQEIRNALGLPEDVWGMFVDHALTSGKIRRTGKRSSRRNTRRYWPVAVDALRRQGAG